MTTRKSVLMILNLIQQEYFTAQTGKNITTLALAKIMSTVYVNRADICNSTDQGRNKKNFDNNFFESSLYKSSVVIASHMHDRQNMVNEYLNKSGKSLYNLQDGQEIPYNNIMNLLDKCVVVNFKLHSLPDLSKLSDRKIQESTVHTTSLECLVPGDIINADKLKNIDSSMTISNILVDVSDGTTKPFVTFNYTDCYEYNDNDPVTLDFVTYKSYLHYPTESFYKFNVFDEIVKRKHYGVHRKYLNKKYKCLKITICSEFKRRKLIIPSVRVINLGQQTNNSSIIFNSENLVLRYTDNNETHYVARTETGNCLFQSLIFPNDDDIPDDKKITSPLLYMGKIISANNNHDLEKWAESFVNNLTITSHKTLHAVGSNPITRASFFSELSLRNDDNTLTNIYLDKLY
ncbi:uncharacterized protein LOC130673461 isoform X2 [Microplitis mediator]|uniref:uncharacterized protein LOC130673461 isoform X2 n=1 Tax=Microplitis mediator TaxID=375433 RepID=UPI0025538CDB|nr:uncharacterized protein LOC130673461 isoform X2 [Microplitis mediator]